MTDGSQAEFMCVYSNLHKVLMKPQLFKENVKSLNYSIEPKLQPNRVNKYYYDSGHMLLLNLGIQ